MNKIAFCPKCGHRLIPSVIDGYAWTCEECDEDFYSVEVEEFCEYEENEFDEPIK